VKHETLTWCFSFVLPALAMFWAGQELAWRVKRARPRGGTLLLLGLSSLSLVAVPVGEFSLARWLAAFLGHFSLPLHGVLAVAIWERATGRRLFSGWDWRAAWIFGAVAGMILYPAALGWGRFDPYTLGWAPAALGAAAGLLTLGLLWRGSWFGLLLLAATLAWPLQLMESANYWDYLIDPVYLVISLGGLAALGARRWLVRPARSSEKSPPHQ
jgi:hypothetical protein